MDMNDVMNMSEEEFMDYMIEDYKEKPSYEEMVKNTGKTEEELVKEINAYNAKLLNLANKYELSLKNKAAFILKLTNLEENKESIMPLLSCFICKPDYIFNIENRKVSVKNHKKIIEYMQLKKDICTFERYYSNISVNKEKYEGLIKEVKIKVNTSKLDMTSSTKELLCKLYNKYISKKQPLIENIEHIHQFAMGSEARQNLYPLIVFRAFTKYKSSITNKNFLINEKNIMNYKEYSAVQKYNGKNFKEYENYIYLFLELVNKFSNICDVEVCMYGFERICNLVNWVFENTLRRDIFHHTSYSLVQSTYGSIFYEKSIFWDTNDVTFDEYAKFNEVDSNNNDHFLSKIQGNLSKDNKEVKDYLNEYIKGPKYIQAYVTGLAGKLFDMDKYRDKPNNSETCIYLMIEGELQEGTDKLIKEEIIKFLN